MKHRLKKISSRDKPTSWLVRFGIVAFILLAGFGAWNTLRPLPVVPATVASMPQLPGPTTSLALPNTGGAAIGTTGRGLLGTSGDGQPAPIASVAKTITALAVLQKMPLAPGEAGPLFTVTATDVARYEGYVAKNGSVIPVVAGEQLTQQQMLEAMLVPSGNNIADSLAVWAFGSLENYTAYANTMVKGLGMAHTTVGSDASGYAPNTVSTPADLVVLGRAAITHPTLARIVSQTSANLPTVGKINNTNTLLGSHGVIGIKTGTSTQAGACLLFAANHTVADGHVVTLVGSVLGAANRSDALAKSAALIDSATRGFSYETPIHKGDIIATYQLPWGGEAQAIAKDDLAFVRWQGDTVRIHVDATTVNQGVKKDMQLGTLTITTGDTVIAVPLVAAADAPGPSLAWRLLRH